MLKNKPSAILFDLDGTLADSALDLAATLNHLLRNSAKKPIDVALVRNMVGEGAKALLIKGFSHNGETPSEELLDDLFEQYLEYYTDHICVETVLFPGVLEMLDTLKSMDIPLAICTNKLASLTKALLSDLKIDHYFSAVACGDSFEFKKPDPRHLYATCEIMGADPENAIMVGDSINDIAAGKNAHMKTIGVTFGYTETPMSELNADITLDHFDELIPALQLLIVGLKHPEKLDR